MVLSLPDATFFSLHLDGIMGFIPVRVKQVTVVMAPAYSLRDPAIFSLLTYQPAQCGRLSSEAVVGKAT